MAARTARVITASNITWSDASLFNGWLCLLLGYPSFSSTTAPSLTVKDLFPSRPIPNQVWIPIREGVLQHDATSPVPPVFYTTDIVPPGVKYYAYFYDANFRLVAPAAGAATGFTVTATPHTLVPPTLTVPTASSSSPTGLATSFPQKTQ